MESEDFFEILIREHAELLMVYLETAVRDRAAFDDLFQEACLVAWRRIGDFDRTRPFGPWLRGIGGRLVLAHRRKQRKGPLLLEPQALEHLEARCTALHEQVGDTLDEKLRGLRECVESLPPRLRDAIRYRYELDLRGAGLAAELDTTVEGAKKRLQRGRARLLDCLERKLETAETAS